MSIEEVKQLREESGVSIGKCKEALDEAGGDISKAREILKTYSVASAAKKADRDLGAGAVVSYIHSNNQAGTIIEMLCETDFVAKNEDFLSLARDIALHVTAMSSTQESVLEESFVKRPEVTISELIQEAIQKIGERIEIGRITRYAILEENT